MDEQASEDRNIVAGVRFNPVGKIYHFDASQIADLKMGDAVIVETSRGMQLGMVATLFTQEKNAEDGALKKIDRLATPRDLALRQLCQNREPEVVSAAKERAVQLRLRDVKIVGAEYSYDGTRLMIMFSSESEDKVDIKSLRQDMQKRFGPAQVEIRQVGPRDVAKMLGGMGACGLETRCCSRFLTEFSSISIRMAKDQGISLTPAEITGMCGRLRCCMYYEYETYVALKSELPKRNKRVMTPLGEGKVVAVNILAQAVTVELADMSFRTYKKDEIKKLDEPAG